MKKILLLSLSLLIFFSCAVQKRKYQKGYYISRSKSAPVKKEREQELSAKKQTRQEAAAEPPVSPAPQPGKFSSGPSPESRWAVPVPVMESPGRQLIKKDEPCDDIVFRDGNEIKAKVTEVTTTEIKYKKCDMPDGPVYIAKKSDVFMIKYANGSRDVFKEEAKPAQVQQSNKPAVAKRTHPLAVAALVVGILSFILSIFGLITAILAIVFGNLALERISVYPDRYDGVGLAKAGKILGIVYLALLALVLLIVLIFVAALI
jgi:hypothetical protein